MKTYPRGSTVVVGVKVKNYLGVRTNPGDGVDVTITGPTGTVEVAAQACTQGQWDEDDAVTTGQYFYSWASADDDPVGTYSVRFEIDPGGTYPGVELDGFRLK